MDTKKVMLMFGIVLLVFAGFVSAAHTHTTSISPENAKASTPTLYTLVVTNNGDDSVDWVKITKPVGFGDVTCGDAPTNWMSVTPPTTTDCAYYTNTDLIGVDGSETFTVTTTTAASSNTYTWATRTKDDQELYVTTNPTSKVDSVNPASATVTAPVDSSNYKSGDVPTAFTGSVADDNGGSGLSLNSATFYLRDTTEDTYWNGVDSWGTITQLATTHIATTSDTASTWTDAITLPTWTDGHGYEVKATATDKAGNTLEGSEVTFDYDSSLPTVTVKPCSPRFTLKEIVSPSL